MDPKAIILKYYKPDSKAYRVLIGHSISVTKKALEVAKRVPELNPDLKFIEEAAMLHDIGMRKTNAPIIDCHGEFPYFCHGYLGREILEKEGLPKHALVCERHTGTGIPLKDIKSHNHPLPHRDLIPITIEEQIICFADKFFSKKPKHQGKTNNIEQIKASLAKHGNDRVQKFEDWCKLFKEP
ncbi:MAG: HD domain-containing protein [Candidatus Nanoarchaeia archaeon]